MFVRSGTIDVHEFGALWRYIQEWKACFDRYDRTSSYFVLCLILCVCQTNYYCTEILLNF